MLGCTHRLKGKADAVVIVGDAAKGKLEAGKPLELVAVCETGRRRPLVEAARILTADLQERFGLALNVSMLTKREASVSLEIALDGWQLLPSEGRSTISSAS